MTSASTYATEFIENSPDFHKDLDLENIDSKHITILSKSYEEEANGTAFKDDSFRNWKGQSDMDVPIQFKLSGLFRGKGLIYLLRYLYQSLFFREQSKHLYNSILDDISVIREIGGEQLLLENPVHASPGATHAYFIDRTSVNLRWLRYIYIVKRLLDLDVLGKGSVWVDVGSYYGGLQGLLRKYKPETNIVMVDFHHQLCRSYIYLKQMYPDSSHIFPSEISSLDLSTLEPGSFIYVPVSAYHELDGWEVDLVTNIFSLGEMRRPFFEQYFHSDLFKKSKCQYIVNRFVSSPFFEATYDSDLNITDYMSDARRVEFFDVFPMHHFLQLKRSLFGRTIARNLSSSYFEMVTFPAKNPE